MIGRLPATEALVHCGRLAGVPLDFSEPVALLMVDLVLPDPIPLLLDGRQVSRVVRPLVSFGEGHHRLSLLPPFLLARLPRVAGVSLDLFVVGADLADAATLDVVTVLEGDVEEAAEGRTVALGVAAESAPRVFEEPRHLDVVTVECRHAPLPVRDRVPVPGERLHRAAMLAVNYFRKQEI